MDGVPRYPPQQSTKMSNAVAQLGPSVKFTVAKSSRKSCWVRSPQKITVVTGMKSGRKVTIVTGIMVSGTVVNSMKLTNPVTLKTVLPDPNVPRKLPPPQPSRQTRSTAKIRRMARLLQNQILLHFHICQQQREFCTKSDDRKVGRLATGKHPVGGLSVGGCALHRRSSMSPRTRKCHRGKSSCLLSIFRDRRRCRKLYRFPF